MPTAWLLEESLLLLLSLDCKARDWLTTRAFLAASGLTKSLVNPSLLTAGDLCLQWGHEVVTTWAQISLIRSVIRFWTEVFDWWI